MTITDVRQDLLKRMYDHYYQSVQKHPQDASHYAEIELTDVKFQFLSIDYDTYDQLKLTPSKIRTHRINNPSNAEIESSFKESVETTGEFTWSFTEGLKAGTELAFKVGAPFVGEGGVKVTAELSLESTQEKKVSKKDTWEQQVTVKVPAKTSIEATTLLQVGELDTPFAITVVATGWAKITMHSPAVPPVTGDTQWISGGSLERGWGGPGPPPTPWIADQNSLRFKAKGVFKGVSGMYITVDSKPIPP